MVLGATWPLANAKSFIVHENNPDAACMGRKDGETEQSTGNITTAELLCEWLERLDIFVGPKDFDFFVLRTQRAV